MSAGGMSAATGLAHMERAERDGRAIEREHAEHLRRILRRMGVSNFEVLRRAEAIARKSRTL